MRALFDDAAAIHDDDSVGSADRRQAMSADHRRSSLHQPLERFLDEQQDLSPKARPRYVRLVDDLPRTATNKVLHRELTAAGITGVTWTREDRGTRYLA